MLRTVLLSLSLVAPTVVAAQDVPTISVTATGTASARPDMATLRLGVRRQAPTARAALDAANVTMRKVLEAIRAFEIADDDLQTSGLNIRPLVSSTKDGEAPRITGYAVTNTLTVRVRDLSRAGEVLDQAVSLGVNSNGGISFAVSEPAPIVERARREAVRRAVAKAKVLAGEAGVALGAIRAIREGRGQARPRFAALTRGMAESVPIARGTSEYTVSVTMEWAIDGP